MKLLDTTTVALALFFFVLSAVGCVQPNDPTVMSNNKATLAGDGEEIGTLPDGRKLVRYRLQMGSQNDHWVYVTNNTITINHTEQHGKTSSNHTEVIIDGVIYQPVEKQ